MVFGSSTGVSARLVRYVADDLDEKVEGKPPREALELAADLQPAVSYPGLSVSGRLQASSRYKAVGDSHTPIRRSIRLPRCRLESTVMMRRLMRWEDSAARGGIHP